jgi:predicted nucleic acid-binding protein
LSVYLLDTNVVSAIAPTMRRTASDEELALWIEAHGDDLRLSVITHAEIRAGIMNVRRKGATRKADMLAAWWAEILHYWQARILPFDIAVAEEAARLLDVARFAGSDPGFEDIAIAATAVVHDLTVLTRNVRHFQPLGVPFIDPWKHLPPNAFPASENLA